MKTCPYCAEEIKDEAIRCRWCLTWLVSDPPKQAMAAPSGVADRNSGGTPTTTESPMLTQSPTMSQPSGIAPQAGMSQPMGAPQSLGQAASPADRVEFTHSGERYLLGYAADHFGIWDRQSPAQPTERFPRTDDGWRQAWQRYVAVESNWMDLRTGQRS